jgi:hypothetical protein
MDGLIKKWYYIIKEPISLEVVMRFTCRILAVLILIFTGCSRSSLQNPATPLDQTSFRPTGETSRHLWGIWDVYISADRESAEAVPVRTSEMHINAVRLLEVAPCNTCLKIGNVHITGPKELSADLTITHPFPGLLKYTGFDVRGIFISQADYTFPSSGRKIALGDSVPRMLNPDGFTTLFNPTDFPPTTPAALGYIPGKHSTGGELTSTLNPYVAYRKDAPRCMFEAGGTETKTVKIHAPAGPLHFGYAIDGSWTPVDNVIDPEKDFPPDANCLEAHKINVEIGPGLTSAVGSEAPISLTVYDHQGKDTISSVTVEAPDLFAGEVSLSFSTVLPDVGCLYTGAISNQLGAAGDSALLVRAIDTSSDPTLGGIDAWQIAALSLNEPKGWARVWGNSAYDRGYGVAVDGFGNVYVTGQYSGNCDFDPGQGVDKHIGGLTSVFLSKFDSSGNYQWARTWGGGGYDNGTGVAVDEFGNVYVIGGFHYTVDFDPGPGVDNHTSPDIQTDAFLSKFDSSGNFKWARTWGEPGIDAGTGVAVDASGNVYATGEYFGTADFDPGPGVDEHSSFGNTDIFLSKFDSSGNFKWARTWGGTDDDSGGGISADGSGNAYVTGFFMDTVDFDPGPGVDNHLSDAARNVFLSKFDSSGNFIWARTWGGTSSASGPEVTVDGYANAYVTGRFCGMVDFDPGPGVDNHSSYGNEDVFLSKFDSSGNFLWARTWGGQWDDDGNGVSVDVYGNTYVTGFFQDTVDFDPGSGVDNHSSYKYSWGFFLSKFDPSGNFLWARTWWSGVGYGVAVDGSGNAYATGQSIGDVDFDPGPGVDKHYHFGYGIFLTKFPPDGNW